MGERVTERTDGITTERVTEPTSGGTTVIETSGGGGSGVGLFIGLILIAALVIGGIFLLNQNSREQAKTDAITSAAKTVEKSVDRVGTAAEKAGDAVTNTVQ